MLVYTSATPNEAGEATRNEAGGQLLTKWGSGMPALIIEWAATPNEVGEATPNEVGKRNTCLDY